MLFSRERVPRVRIFLVLLIAAGVVATFIAVPISLNGKRKRRGELRAHGAFAIAAVSVLTVASFAVAVVSYMNEASMGVWSGLVAFLALWIALVAMAARGTPARQTAVYDTAVPHGGSLPQAAPPEPAPGAQRSSGLEIAAQIAGILSLVVSIVALVLTA
jgi:hypothetical protein